MSRSAGGERPDTAPVPGRHLALADVDSLLSSLERRTAERRARARPLSADLDSVSRQTVRELCHDLRQPLAAVQVLTGALADGTGLSSHGQQTVLRLRREVERLQSYVDSLLAPGVDELVDLGALARDVCRGAALTHDGAIEVRAVGRVVCTGDRAALSRALLNLVTNATHAAGQVRVSVLMTPDSAQVVVEDDGTRRQGVGTAGRAGLGSGIVAAVVELHHGRLEHSRSALGGWCVRLVLPAQQSDGPEPT